MKVSDINIEEYNKIKEEEQKEAMDNCRSLFKSKPYTRLKLPNRNDPCTCGSGKKYKNCCMEIDIKLINSYDKRREI